uniref:RNA-dependent RNA polymerase n=3 Tax=Thielaviopsis basicola mitovirus TaxID=274584 RepID=Q3S3F3_9VIRU|nr:RNA-dependent RNA polymerase [Thielaviopsis basicola mitovirus]
MIKYMKSVRLHITRYICRKPLFINNSGVSVDKSGFPTKFIELKKFLNNHESSICYHTRLRIILTLLLLPRGLKPTKAEDAKIKPNFSSITLPFSGTRMNPIPTWFIKEFVKEYNLKLEKPTYDLSKHYLSPKGGPMGKSTWSSIWSMYALKHELHLSLSYFLGEAYKTLFYLPYLKNMALSYGHDVPPKQWPSGKLGIVKDPEGKRRIIAMVDYHSQLVLRSIHDGLLNKLRNLPQDRTYNQDPNNAWEENKECFHSLDLSSATDRFPVKLQSRLLTEMYSDPSFGENWMNLLLNRDYLLPEEGLSGERLRYAVGQPMGAYSSWAAFTLSHHLVVAWCTYKSKKVIRSSQYIILGDDIVIKDNDIARKYIGQMSKLGVAISMQKTHVSKDTYEFAKRWVHKGVEISGLPLKGIFYNISHMRRMYTIIFDYLQRIPSKSNLTSLQLFASCLSGIKFGKRVYSKALILKLLRNFNISLRYSYGLLTPYELREYILTGFNMGEEVLPSDNRILEWFKGIICDGVAGKVSTLSREYTKEVDSLEEHKSSQHILNSINIEITYENLQWSPLIIGMFNHINKVSEKCGEWLYGDVPLMDIIQQFTLPSADSLSRKDRDINKKVDELDSLIFKSIKRHFSDQPYPDHFYGTRSNGDKYLYPGLGALDVNVAPEIGFEIKSPINFILKTEIQRLHGNLEMQMEKPLREAGINC